VASATNGREALDYLAGNRPCVILLDLQMPLMNGWDFAAEFCKRSELSEIPIIVVSAFLSSVRVPKEITPIACISKPIVLDDLFLAIAKACG